MRFYDITFFAEAPLRLEFTQHGSMRIEGLDRVDLDRPKINIFVPPSDAEITERAVAAYNAVIAEWKPPAPPPPATPVVDDMPF